MKMSRREFLIFAAGFLSLCGLGYLISGKLRMPRPAVSNAEPDDGFVLPDNAGKQMHRLNGVEFSVDRTARTVKACDASGKQLWESHGADKFIIPGAAFPLDLTPDGELWAGNVGRKRLEQLDVQTGKFIASWEPNVMFGGCCNPARFAALAGGRFLTMEKGVRRICIYQPSGELERIVSDGLSASEHNYYLFREGRTIHLYDTGARKHWEVPYDVEA